MAKESDASRYLRSTISNIAFLALLGFAIHEKSLTETSIVTIVMFFLGGYFGVRAYQHRTEVDIAASQSNPRMPIPNYQRFPPQDPPDEPPRGSAPPGEGPTRPYMEKPLIPRTDEMPTNPGGRGRFKKWIVSILHSGFAPVGLVLAACLVWGLLYLIMHHATSLVGLAGAMVLQ